MKAIVITIVGLLVLASHAYAASIDDEAVKLAAGIVKGYQTSQRAGDSAVDQSWQRLLMRSVAEQSNPEDLARSVLKLHQAMAETARTDKQTGAPPSSTGTTTLATKPGIEEFLSVALERGAVSKETNGTSTTLATSPYSIATILGGVDDAETYSNYGFLTRIGFTATFPVSNNGNDNVNSKELNSWAAKLRLVGDRSPRSRAFVENWERTVKPLIVERLKVIAGTTSDVFNDNRSVKKRSDDEKAKATATIRNYLVSTTDDTNARILQVARMLLTGMSPVADEIRSIMTAEQVQSLRSAYDRTGIDRRLQAALDDLARSPLLTLEYIDQKQQTSSDVSEVRLSFEKRVTPVVDLIANGIFSFYNNPDRSIGQETVKEYGATVSLEGRFNNVFKQADSLDLSVITASLSGSLVRQEGEASGTRGNAQLRLEIPIWKGITLPLAVTYASRTDTSSESEVRANIGVIFDLQKLQALSRLPS